MAAAPAGRCICLRAQKERPSHPTRQATAASIILQRKASAQGEGTKSMRETPTTPTKLATEHTDAVIKTALIVRTLNVQSHAGCVMSTANVELRRPSGVGSSDWPRGNHLLKRIPKIVPRTKSATKHQRAGVEVRNRLHGQNGGSQRHRQECAPSANHIQLSKSTQPTTARTVAARSTIWRRSVSADTSSAGRITAPAMSVTTNQSIVRIALDCCVDSCMACACGLTLTVSGAGPTTPKCKRSGASGVHSSAVVGLPISGDHTPESMR